MIILASASPRRKQLLSEIAQGFEVRPSFACEISDYRAPHMLVKELARIKAQNVANQAGEDDVVIGADTVVCFGKKMLGKPADEEQAKSFLRMLSGKRHSVYTGVCVIRKTPYKIWNYYCKTDVFFNDLSEEFIDAYVRSGSPMDKAGAYGIQDGGLVRKIQGDYDNVVGLPLGQLSQIIGEINGNS